MHSVSSNSSRNIVAASITLESVAPTPAPAGVLRIAVYFGCSSFLLSLIAFNFVDIDVWHQMNLIRASLAAGHLLTADPFSYAPTVHPMIDHEWGAGVLALFFGKWMGAAGILFLKFAAAFATLFLTMRTAERRGASAALLGFTCPLAIGLLSFGFLSAVRAQAYSFLFAAALLSALETARRPDRPKKDSRREHGPDENLGLWAFLVVFPIWVNVHAGFVVGLGFVFLYCLEQVALNKPARIALVVLCAMLLEILLNPYGVRYFSYLARALPMARPRIPEWSPIWTLGGTSTLLFALAVGVAIYALVQLKTWRISGALLLTATIVEALLHRKLLPFFAITWLSYVPAYLQRTLAADWLRRFAQKRRLFLILAWSTLVVVCLSAAIRQRFWRAEVPQVAGEPSYPVGAVDYMTAYQFHGNIMVPFRIGSYVSWKLYPAAKVSVDSRYEVAYPNGWVERVFRFYEADQGTHDNWRETLDAYATDLVLAPRTSPVLPSLYEMGWQRVYVDAQFEIAGRPGGQLPAVDRSAFSFAGVFP